MVGVRVWVRVRVRVRVREISAPMVCSSWVDMLAVMGLSEALPRFLDQNVTGWVGQSKMNLVRVRVRVMGYGLWVRVQG